MWQGQEPSPTEQRDRALDRLRRWTWGIALGAVGLVGLFSVMAAGSFPGRSSNPPSGSASTGGGDDQAGSGGDSSQSFSPDFGGGQPQAPGQGFFGSGSNGGGGFGGGRGAVSGGS